MRNNSICGEVTQATNKCIKRERPHAKRKMVVFVVSTMVVLTVAFLAGCAPQQPSQKSELQDESQDAEAVAFIWSKDSDCAVCHSQQASSLKNDDCLASRHALTACIVCHDDMSSLEDVHADIEATGEVDVNRLKKTVISEINCQSCHGDDTTLAEATQSVLALTDSNGTTVNPHMLPGNVEHGDIDCSSCHIMHENSNVVEQSKSFCASCHHEGVYECFTCHA